MNTPVLFICFARPNYARQTFNAIKAAKPKNFYFYSNHARADNPDEIIRNNECRLLAEEVDWDCNFHKFFREDTLNVYDSIHKAIDWVFEKEDKAIIIEEDIVPSLAFFDFEEKMLNKYENDHRIWTVCGTNYFENYNPHKHDYIFTHYFSQHGWGTWKNRWNKIDWSDIDIKKVIQEGVIDSIYSNKKQRKFNRKYWIKISNFLNKTKCWDGMFEFNILKQGGVAIVSSRHLVQDIGVSGEHFKGKITFMNMQVSYKKNTYNINSEPPFILPDFLYDNFYFYHNRYENRFMLLRIVRKIMRFIKKHFIIR